MGKRTDLSRGSTLVFRGKDAEAVVNALAGREVVKPNTRNPAYCFKDCAALDGHLIQCIRVDDSPSTQIRIQNDHGEIHMGVTSAKILRDWLNEALGSPASGGADGGIE
jgi:hypothetical protein